MPVLGAALSLLSLLTGCDQGKRDDEASHGPPLHLVASYPVDGQGTAAAFDADVNCEASTPDCPVPTDVAIELRFDRFLLPGGGLAGGLSLYSGNPPANGVALDVDYDLIERVAVFRPRSALEPHTLYTAEVEPGTNPSVGFWAFDLAPLVENEDPSAPRLRFGFTTGSGPRASTAKSTLKPAPDTCDTIPNGPLSSCSGCHVTEPGAETSPPSKYPPMGLDLSSAPGLFYTAVAHVAHQAETGATAANAGRQTPLRFGVQMNVIDPGNPATSYLMYKLLQKPENFRLAADEASCLTPYHSPVSDGACTPPDAGEITRLHEWFVLGDPMPKNRLDPTSGAVSMAATTHADLVRMAAWISAGAACPDPESGASSSQ